MSRFENKLTGFKFMGDAHNASVSLKVDILMGGQWSGALGKVGDLIPSYVYTPM